MSLPNRPHGIRAATAVLVVGIAFGASALLPGCAAPRAVSLAELASAPAAPRAWFDSQRGHAR